MEPEGFEPSPSRASFGAYQLRGALSILVLRSHVTETAGIEPASCSVQARGALPEHVPTKESMQPLGGGVRRPTAWSATASTTEWPAAVAAATRCRPSRTTKWSPFRATYTGGALKTVLEQLPIPLDLDVAHASESTTADADIGDRDPHGHASVASHGSLLSGHR